MIYPPIVCISTIDWDFLWQRHQIMMSHFASNGIPVLFIENTGGRAPQVKDLSRLSHRFHNLALQLRYGPRRKNGVTILSPLAIPWNWASNLNTKLAIPLLVHQIRQLGFRTSMIWTYTPSTLAMTLIKKIESQCLVYDCVASIKGYAYATTELIENEYELCQHADIILTDARSLYEEKLSLNPNTYHIPPGVNYEQFAPSRFVEEPRELENLPRPRLCFFGTLGWWVDYQLLREFALKHPNWSIILIGAVKTDVTPVIETPNVHFLGTKPHLELPKYLSVMDVLTIPYVVDDFSLGVFPAKLFECLSTGKPVVSTAIPEVIRYSEVIHIADKESFALTVEHAFLSDNKELRQRRMMIARANSWDSRFSKIEEVLSRVLKEKRLA